MEALMTPPMDIRKIMELLPHRYPFVLVDRVLEITPGEQIIALKNVTINEPFFQGHFPEKPIMPGVLLVEAMGQAGGVLYMASKPEAERDVLFYFMGFDKVRFRTPVVPGDQVILDVKVLNLRKRAVKMEAEARVGDRMVAQAELMAAIGEKE
jgi:3-hydroxyacyl-[acyl-carrier-protein] dehydratase